jgi:hypothetical protein
MVEIENLEEIDLDNLSDEELEEVTEKASKMTSFKLNGKDYKIKKYDFNAMVRLQQLGFVFQKEENDNDSSFANLRAIIAYNTGMSSAKAGDEIQQHLNKTGAKGLQKLYLIMSTLEQSDFFKSLQ